MMYNPYNWKIVKEKKTHKCILDELGIVCAELELAKMELKDVEKRISDLEDKKASIIDCISDEEDNTSNVDSNLQVNENTVSLYRKYFNRN